MVSVSPDIDREGCLWRDRDKHAFAAYRETGDGFECNYSLMLGRKCVHRIVPSLGITCKTFRVPRGYTEIIHKLKHYYDQCCR